MSKLCREPMTIRLSSFDLLSSVYLAEPSKYSMEVFGYFSVKNQ